MENFSKIVNFIMDKFSKTDSYSENDMENFSEIAKNRDELGWGGVTHRKRDEIIYIFRVSGGIF